VITFSFFIFCVIFLGVISLYIKDSNFKFILALIIALGYAFFWSQQPMGNGHDVDRYYSSFLNVPYIYEYSLNASYGHFYTVVMSLTKSVGIPFYGFLFLTFFVTMFLYILSFKLLTKNYVFSLSIIVILVEIFISTIRLQRQGMAVAFLFLSFTYLFKKRKILSSLLLPIIGSLHMTFIPIYIFFLTLKRSLKYKISIKFFIFSGLVIFTFYISKNLDFILSIFELIQYDSKYATRAVDYIEKFKSEIALSASFILMNMIVGLSVFHTYFLYKNKRVNIELNQFTSLVLIFSVIFLLMTKENAIFSRISFYFSPFYALGLTLIIDRLSRYNRLIFALSTLMVLASFFWFRILVKDIARVGFY